MEILKITSGFVTQTFDTDRQAWVNQNFTAGDECVYEVGGDEINVEDFRARVVGGKEPYLPFEMKQPDAQQPLSVEEQNLVKDVLRTIGKDEQMNFAFAKSLGYNELDFDKLCEGIFQKMANGRVTVEE